MVKRVICKRYAKVQYLRLSYAEEWDYDNEFYEYEDDVIPTRIEN